jgi:hypothetical protein
MPGPVPAYNNLPIAPQNFQPSVFDIADITRGMTTTVTMDPSTVGGTTVYPNYVIGQQVRFLIPYFFGMRQINNQVGYVLSVPTSTSVVVDIDSRLYNSFISNPPYVITPAQIVAIGDVNSGDINSSGNSSTGTFIEGSFINISN